METYKVREPRDETSLAMVCFRAIWKGCINKRATTEDDEKLSPRSEEPGGIKREDVTGNKWGGDSGADDEKKKKYI